MQRVLSRTKFVQPSVPQMCPVESGQTAKESGNELAEEDAGLHGRTGAQRVQHNETASKVLLPQL